MQPEYLEIINTTNQDFAEIVSLFEQAMKLQGKNNYKVWDSIDTTALAKDIERKLQYKIVKDDAVLCLFSIQHNAPFIWRGKDKDNALYLHRIVTNPAYKGQKLFEKVLNWAMQFAQQNNLQFIRMDTWAENKKIIDYYLSFGFVFIENYQTPKAPELPIQNRNLLVALLEMKL